jgi:hypothetical protein
MLLLFLYSSTPISFSYIYIYITVNICVPQIKLNVVIPQSLWQILSKNSIQRQIAPFCLTTYESPLF